MTGKRILKLATKAQGEVLPGIAAEQESLRQGARIYAIVSGNSN